MPADNYKLALTSLHSASVSEEIGKQSPNRVLGLNPPPSIASSEAQLDRRHRTLLAQLRSGFCVSLRDYNKTVGKIVDDLCPECRAHPQTVVHLFACAAAPTNLTVRNLWDRPREVIRHLLTLSSFDDFPPLVPPLPPRPPRPPD